MARFAVLALCAVTVLSGTSAESPVKYGMTMSTRAYDAVCWYVNLKQFPNTNSNGFMSCQGQAQSVVSQISSDDDAKQYFGPWMIQLAMTGLPDDWPTICNDYLTDSAKTPPSDEKDALNDADPNDYPFKGFAYCMMNKLRSKFGEKAIKAVEDEMTHRTKDWRKTLLDRDNEFRARHGVPAFTMDSGLNSAAQTWAETMANACNLYHSENDDPGRQWHGAGTGESIAEGGSNPDSTAPAKAVSAYLASDMWYEEIKNYPYPQGHTSGDGLFEKIGHFTQTVWKNTKYVGYGYAFSQSCGNWFIAGRYSPAGNGDGEFQANVLPPKN
ncbi:Golgi-associated plant pathogenesis-related protein 1 [Orchesella cincta]|uniref:Golgi-associated plant pathogenesis-related protein 1 n=1 Tax=Orchesella cincta TaxID=48709 RepID=A0A1D2N2V8_ORCCI|nr:Golgi-associated plant pathogenesis-related protein 1 [Orchesella cincta]